MSLAKSRGWAAFPSEATEARMILQAWLHPWVWNYTAMGTAMCPAQYSVSQPQGEMGSPL